MSPSYGTARISGAVLVGTGSTPVVAEDPSRRKLILTNDGANPIYVQLQTDPAVDPVAVVGQGIRLNAQGGSYTEDEFQGSVAAIAMTAATNLCVVAI